MKHMEKFAVSIFVAFTMMTVPVLAQGLRAVAPLQGYSCMSLNLTEDDMQHESSLPIIRQESSISAPTIGRASALVIVANPIRSQNGYVAVLTLDGRPGWVEANKLKPYRSPSNPSARCIPSRMSNGQPGFNFQH